MNRKLAAFLAGAQIAAMSGAAVARDSVSFSLSIGVPGYAYVAPVPVYYPSAVYYATPTVSFYYVSPAVHVAPAPAVIVRPGYGPRKHWHKRYW